MSVLILSFQVSATQVLRSQAPNDKQADEGSGESGTLKSKFCLLPKHIDDESRVLLTRERRETESWVVMSQAQPMLSVPGASRVFKSVDTFIDAQRIYQTRSGS